MNEQKMEQDSAHTEKERERKEWHRAFTLVMRFTLFCRLSQCENDVQTCRHTHTHTVETYIAYLL